MATPRIVVTDSTGELLATTGEVTFGTRTGCSVVLDDAIAAARHCAFAHDGQFTVRDLGSVTGTWLDGVRVVAPTAVRDGATVVFGASRAVAKLEERDGAPTLALQLARNGFWWKKSGKKVFDNDPDALVRAEVAFGRFPLLRAGNRLALVFAAVLLLGGAFVASVMARLADPGPLMPTHALVTSNTPVPNAHAGFTKCRALAEAQGCNVCHTTGQGAPEQKCLQCHDDLRAEGGRRHPYVVDGVLGDKTGQAATTFCVRCHVDHVGDAGGTMPLKPAAKALVGKCEACHGEGKKRADLIADSRPQLPPARQRVIDTWTFPHQAHAAVDCRICHAIDAEVKRNKAAGFPDDANRDDFATVTFETCASCHVDGAPAVGMSKEQQTQLAAKEKAHRFTVAWHGTDDNGSHCAACHASRQAAGATLWGPELKTVSRPRLLAAQYTTERARYTTASRTHKEQFDAHVQGRECTECHRSGVPGVPPPATRPFWHALHVTDGALSPAAADGGRISTDTEAGCVSCHQDVLTSKQLTDATTATYHWPTTAKEQAACSTTCHREGDRALTLTAAATTIAAELRAPSPQFPHDLHLASKSPTLAAGCFACHAFERPAGAGEFQAVPRTLPDALDCTKCHGGHANVGGGQCQVCHPATADRSNAFLAAAKIAPGTLLRGKASPPEPTRSWVGSPAFSHLSIGHREHVEKDCSECHDSAAVGKSDSLANVPVPNDATPACRECHLEKQFHWR